MIKLKFNLDPADKTQMLALSRFAGTLAGAGVEIQTNKPEGIKPENPSLMEVITGVPERFLSLPYESIEDWKARVSKLKAEEAAKPEQKQEAAPASTRKRRTKAEIEAERAAANAEIPEEEADPEAENEEAENEEAEEVEEAEEDSKSEVKSTAERGGKKITMDEVRAAVAEKKDRHFDKMKRELLNRYGVATTPKLPEEHWAAFYDFVNGLD